MMVLSEQVLGVCMNETDKIFCPYCFAEINEATNHVDSKTHELVITGHCTTCKGTCELDRIPDYLFRYKDLKKRSGYSSNPQTITKLNMEQM